MIVWYATINTGLMFLQFRVSRFGDSKYPTTQQQI